LDVVNLMLYRILLITFALSLSACSSWVYRIDVPQGNYLEQKDIDKLQIDMTKDQVKFILGSPVLVDSFNNDTWHYAYIFKSGRSDKFNMRKDFVIHFKNDKVVSAKGDFKLSDNFNTPMEN